MVDTVRTRDELLNAFQDNEQQLIQPQAMRDYVVSVMGVAGGEVRIGGSTGDSSNLPNNGIQSTPTGLEVQPGGAGLYLFMAQGGTRANVSGDITVRIIKNGDLNSPDYVLTKEIWANERGRNDWTLFETYQLVEGDTVTLSFELPPGMSLVSPTYAFMGIRVG